MGFDFRIPLFGCAGLGTVIYVISFMPPLTSGNGPTSGDLSEEAFEATLAAERAYCLNQPEALDCQCFARQSGAILSHSAPRVPGAFYADKQSLARGQARRGC